MRKDVLLTGLLLLAAVALRFVPAGRVDDARLFVYGFCPSAPAADPRPDTPAQDARDLRDRLMEKDAEIAALRIRLARIAEFREYLPTLRFRLATLIAKNGDGDVIVLDAGAADDVAEGDAVVQGQALCATVGRVGARASQALLLTATGSLVAGRTDRTREDCVVQGRGDGEALAVFYATAVQAKAGDGVLTSGLLGRTPKDLLIGVLAEDPQAGAEAGTFEAKLTPRATFSALEDLLLVQAGTPDAGSTATPRR